MIDVTLHTPEWVEDNGLSNDVWIVFRCTACASNTKWIKRKDYDKGVLPPTGKHFPQ